MIRSAAVSDETDVVHVDVTEQRSAGDGRDVREQVLRVRQRRQRRRLHARPRVVRVAHHDAAVRSEVVADVVVPGVVVAVAVADDDDRQLTERRDVRGIVEVLPEERPARVEDFRHRVGTRESRRVEHPEPGHVVRSVGVVAARELSVAVEVDHRVVADAEPSAGETREHAAIDEPRVAADPAGDDRDRLRGRAHVVQAAIVLPLGDGLVRDDVQVAGPADELGMQHWIDRAVDEAAFEERALVREERPLVQAPSRELERNEAGNGGLMLGRCVRCRQHEGPDESARQSEEDRDP
jgi:hypothetical protein